MKCVIRTYHFESTFFSTERGCFITKIDDSNLRKINIFWDENIYFNNKSGFEKELNLLLERALGLQITVCNMQKIENDINFLVDNFKDADLLFNKIQPNFKEYKILQKDKFFNEYVKEGM